MTTQQLEDLIKRAATAYYAGNAIMSDVQFDRYVAWLEALNPNSDVLKKTGWGYSPESVPGDKVRHIHGGMQSIDNKPRELSYVPNSLRTNVRISAKLDGLSGKLEFVNGKFVRCVTRGNGEEGIDKTDKFRVILERCGGVSLPESFTGEIRGEFVISQHNWNTMMEAGTVKKNARNTAAGLINCDGIPEDLKYLDFVPYKVIWDPNGVFSNKLLDEMGDCEFCKYFPNFPHLPKVFRSEHYTQEELLNMYNGWSAIWPCDGVVITSNIIGKGPEGARYYDEVAFKFDTLKAVTRIESIDWQISRQSLLIPVANLTPVEIDGATITRCTLHNAAFVKALGICEGAEIEIMRSGGVIPKFMSVVSLPKEAPQPLPPRCPVCEGDLVMEGVHLRCTSPGCGNVEYQTLRVWFNFIGRIDGVAEATAFSYFNRFKIESVEELYAKDLEIFEDIRAESVTSAKFAEVMNKFHTGPHSLVNALQALNIARIGDVTSKKFASDKQMVDTIASALKELEATESISVNNKSALVEHARRLCGDATANSLSENLGKLIHLWKYIADTIIIPEVAEVSLDAIHVCITGKLSMSRKQFEQLLVANGYVVKEDVTRKTKYLITNDANGSSGKHKRANELGTLKISESDMLSLLQ